jgi:hypothetical protein
VNNVCSQMVGCDGKWKLFDPNGKKGEFKLYNIQADVTEKQNVAAKSPNG